MKVEGFRKKKIIPLLNSVDMKCENYVKFFETASSLGKVQDVLPFNNHLTTVYVHRHITVHELVTMTCSS